MTHAPLVVTDETDSQAFSSTDVARPEPELRHLSDFQYVHWRGLPHRSVHIEITNGEEKFFVWERRDGRLEIPGGHVDWIQAENRPESYEEASRREIVEELILDEMWNSQAEAMDRLRGMLIPMERVINQVSSSHVNNNEWVAIFRLCWPRGWPDPCESLKYLALKRKDGKVEGKAESSRWMSLQEIKKQSMARPMAINAALRLFLRRNGIMVPILLTDYFDSYHQYREKICPGLR